MAAAPKADAEVAYGYGYPAASTYQQVSYQAVAPGIHQLNKREALPQGVAAHPNYATTTTTTLKPTG